MHLYQWIRRIPKHYSGKALIHSAIHTQFSSHPKDIREGEKIIEIQACLLMEGTEIFELVFFGTSIHGGLYWPKGNLKDQHDSNISAFVKHKRDGGRAWIYMERARHKKRFEKYFFIVYLMQEIHYYTIPG